MYPSFHKKQWPCKNLGDIARFLESQYPDGMALNKVSEQTGISVQNLSRMFMLDDMKLKKAEEIALSYGYQLLLLFPEKESLLEHNIKQPPYPNAGNLAGLLKYLQKSNISISYMSQRIGVGNSVLIKAFKTGNISMSTLYRILENLRIEVLYNFIKNE